MSTEGRRAQSQVAVESLWGWGQVREGRLLLASAGSSGLDGRWRRDLGALGRDPGQEEVGCKWAVGRLHCLLSRSLSLHHCRESEIAH